MIDFRVGINNNSKIILLNLKLDEVFLHNNLFKCTIFHLPLLNMTKGNV